MARLKSFTKRMKKLAILFWASSQFFFSVLSSIDDNQGSCISCGRTYLKKYDVTSDKCVDCLRSNSPASSPKQTRTVSDFSISKLTNNDDAHEKTSPVSHSSLYDPRYIPNMYNSMMLMAHPASQCVAPQPFSFGLVPVFGRFGSPEMRSLPYSTGIVPGFDLPMTVQEGYHSQLSSRRDWSGLVAK